MSATVSDPELRGRLNLAKLRSVVRARTGSENLEDRPLGPMAAVVVEGSGYVLLDRGAGIGAALAWAQRSGLSGTIHVVVDGDAEGPLAPGVVARRARLFTPQPVVLRLDGTVLSPAEPGQHLPILPADPAHLAAIEPLRRAGAEIVVEHGVVMAELNGLEVGRVMADQEGPGVHLEVGVGRYDREAAQVMEQIRSAAEVREDVLDVVRRHRRADEPPHLLNRLARQRWLRSRVVAEPGLVGAARLEPLEPPLPRDNLIDPVPAFAAGVDDAGRPMVVACAVGVDAEAIAVAADGRDRFDPEAELVYVCPARDQYPIIHALAAALVRPARLVALDGEWIR